MSVLNQLGSHIWLLCDGRNNYDFIVKNSSNLFIDIVPKKTQKIKLYIEMLVKKNLVNKLNRRAPDYLYEPILEKKVFKGPKLKQIYSQKSSNSAEWYAMLYSYLDKFSRYNQFYRPQKVNFDLTYNCNLKCTHCYLNESNFEDAKKRGMFR